MKRRFRVLEGDLAHVGQESGLIFVKSAASHNGTVYQGVSGRNRRRLRRASEGVGGGRKQKLQSDTQGGRTQPTDNGQLSPIPPLPTFTGLWRMLEIAPLTQLTTAGTTEDQGGGASCGPASFFRPVILSQYFPL